MARIHFWMADTGGSGIYRGVLPGMSLQWLGHHVTWGIVLPPDWEQLDAVVGCRVAKASASQTWQKMRANGTRLIADFDDDYFHLDRANTEAYKLWSQPLLRRGLIDNITAAHTVTCCSEPLANVLRQHHDDVRVIENALPAQYLAEVRDYDPEVLSVGWAGTSSTVAELPMAARALRRIADYPRPGGVRVRIVGLEPQQAMKAGVQGKRCGALGWVKDFGHYLKAVAEFDVWVAPYRDIAFNRAKYPTKFLESSMLGIPLIASGIEPYRRVIRHGENGLLVPPGQEHLFGRYLKELADDPGLRKRIGMTARGEASGRILQAVNQQWEQALLAPERAAA